VRNLQRIPIGCEIHSEGGGESKLKRGDIAQLSPQKTAVLSASPSDSAQLQELTYGAAEGEIKKMWLMFFFHLVLRKSP
jgi:hypothetical protein